MGTDQLILEVEDDGTGFQHLDKFIDRLRITQYLKNQSPGDWRIHYLSLRSQGPVAKSNLPL